MLSIDSRMLDLVKHPFVCRSTDLGACPDISLWRDCVSAVEDGCTILTRRFVPVPPKWQQAIVSMNVIFASHPDRGAYFIGQWTTFLTDPLGEERHGCAHADRYNYSLVQRELFRSARISYAESLRIIPMIAWASLIVIALLAVGLLLRPPLLPAVALALTGVVLVKFVPRAIVNRRGQHYWSRDETARLIDYLDAANARRVA